MKTVRPKKRAEQPEVVPNVVASKLPIHQKGAGQKLPDMSEELLDLIHLMMRVRQLELDLLGRYLFQRDRTEAEKLALVEALEEVLHSAQSASPPRSGARMRMRASDPDIELASNRCPVGFHEVDGRCVPD